ncbi:hypothetical protein BDN72DRAFT_474049 [Pluteus cervinus]|uniref:Uncharacterized protein n=1 Tax=Pluteus cervinus TaxID=181527 RepID=A0ACD3B0Q4_9AGAR|nr:hypothetical protein BDN72DRAFT_474049 [Pluteus cervinus]
MTFFFDLDEQVLGPTNKWSSPFCSSTRKFSQALQSGRSLTRLLSFWTPVHPWSLYGTILFVCFFLRTPHFFVHPHATMLSSPSIRPTLSPLSFSGHQFILGVLTELFAPSTPCYPSSVHPHASRPLIQAFKKSAGLDCCSYPSLDTFIVGVVCSFFITSASSSPLARLLQVFHPDQHRPDVFLLGHQFTLGSLFLGSSIRNTASTSCCIIRNTPSPRSSTPMAFSSLSTRLGQSHRGLRHIGT